MTNSLELHTERLLLRSIKLDDAEALFKYRSDPLINQYQAWIPKSIDDVYDFIENQVSQTINLIGTWHQFVIIKKETNELIGDTGIHFLDSDNDQVEIGCTLDIYHQGKGYATEALKELINYIFTELHKHKIIGSIDPRNSKSIKLVERLGFRKEAHIKNSVLIRGEWTDDLVYAILKNEWINSRDRSPDLTL